jgi:hypothetical protein
MLRIARRAGPGDHDVVARSESLAAQLARLVERHGPLELEVSAQGITLGGRVVQRAVEPDPASGSRESEHELPWLLHRDGVRRVRFAEGLEPAEALVFLGSLAAMVVTAGTHEDLVTLLWDADPARVRLETREVSPVRLDPHAPDPGDDGPPHPSDWPLPEAPAADLKRLWQDLEQGATASAEDLLSAFARERAEPFAESVERFVGALLELDPREGTAEALAAAIVTWIATAAQRGDWGEALRALDVLWRVDPARRHCDESLTHALGAVDAVTITERLDEASASEQGRLFAFAVGVGAPALPLLTSVLDHSHRARVRAGATTALAYAFADDPSPLAAWLSDTRWHVVRNIVFALGQIGGPEVVPLLAHATRHLDARVRRAAVHALGQVPPAWRRPVLLAQLDAQDARLLTAVLAMLARDPDSRVAESVLARVVAPEFSVRPEEERVLLVGSLPDLAGEAAVAVLGELLVRGGWFAHASAERSAVAQALRRVGNPLALATLEQGLRHRSFAVREACEQALAWEESA